MSAAPTNVYVSLSTILIICRTQSKSPYTKRRYQVTNGTGNVVSKRRQCRTAFLNFRKLRLIYPIGNYIAKCNGTPKLSKIKIYVSGTLQYLANCRL